MDMPRLADAELRAMIAAEDRSQLQLEQSPWNRTGFVGVIQVGGKYYSRLQVAGDGRGGVKKRRQVSLPGPWDTAEDAAVVRAVMIRGFKESGDGKIHSPPKQNKPHKPRAVKRSEPAAAQPAFEPVQTPMATAMAVPLAAMMPHAPIACATPLPMQPLLFAPLM